jgi:predicted ATPase
MLHLSVSNAGVDLQYQEKLTYQGSTVFTRDSITGLQYNGATVYANNEFTALRVLVDRGEIHPAIRRVSDLLARIGMFEEPDLVNLRKQGSPAFDDVQLSGRGENVLSILRKWQQGKQSKHRFDFVIQGIQAAFPSVTQIDFDGAGNTLTARMYHRGVEQLVPLAHEANGLLQMMVLLANVAQSEPGGVVAIDEPENGLHPYAMRMFLRSCQQWALTYRVTLVLATHSLVLLDEFTAIPEAVFVMKALEGEDNSSVPNALDHLRNRDWLEGFKLGDLYEQGEIGSNDDGQ